MLRRAIVAYLVLMMAAGPSLCCCSVPHVFATSAERPVSLPSCCHAAANRAETPSCPREHNSPRKPGCPCREDAPRPALLDRAAEMPVPMVVAFLTPALFLDASASPVSVNGGAAWQGGPPLPFLTAQDLLRLHHQMRC